MFLLYASDSPFFFSRRRFLYVSTCFLGIAIVEAVLSVPRAEREPQGIPYRLRFSRRVFRLMPRIRAASLRLLPVMRRTSRMYASSIWASEQSFCTAADRRGGPDVSDPD